MKFELMASMMCADYGHLEREVRELEAGGIDSFHIDIMDGRYVPNYAMSLNDMKCIRGLTDKPLDVHLMIEHPSTTLQKIINADMIPGIAINPGTSIETVMEMLQIVDKVLVMSVNPGNAGQMYLPYVGNKIDRLLALKEKMGFELFWDGACSADKILEYAPKGVNGFVLGTTLLFGKDKSYGETLKNIREMKF